MEQRQELQTGSASTQERKTKRIEDRELAAELTDMMATVRKVLYIKFVMKKNAPMADFEKLLLGYERIARKYAVNIPEI